MLRTTRLRKGADEVERGLRNACHFPPCRLIPFKGTSHAPFSKSTPLAQQSGQMNTWHQSLGQTAWGQDGHCLCRASLLPWIGGETLVSLHWLFGLSGYDQACGQRCLNGVQVQQRKLSEEPARKHMGARDRRERQKWETSGLGKGLRRRSGFGYWWLRVVLSLPGDWGVLFCILALFPCVTQ